MALNQGVEDQLLFDASKSYFVDPGYTRTSNFQMHLVDVEPVNSAAPGQTVQFLLPPSGDVLGALDLAFQFNNPTNPGALSEPLVTTHSCYAAWIESVGYGIIDYVEFTVGSTVLERLTGDQMYIMNELRHPHERATTQVGTTGTSAVLQTSQTTNNELALSWSNSFVSAEHNWPGVNDKWNRMIDKEQTRKYHVPLPFHFTLSPGKFFPMAAVHGINDVRVTMRLRSLEEIVLIKPWYKLPDTVAIDPTIVMPKFASGVFKHFRLRAQYYTLSGPEASALAAKEQVRLYNEWQHLRSLKTIRCTPDGQLSKVDIDLNFLHPVKEIIMVVRRASEMTNDVTTNRGLLGGHSQLNQGPATKNRFAFHGNPDVRDPNIEGLKNSYVGSNPIIPLQAFDVHTDIDNFRLKLNGSERHTNIADGLSREYLQDQIVARQRPHTFGAQSKIGQIKHAVLVAHHTQIPDTIIPIGAGTTNQLIDRMVAQIDHSLDSKSIFVYPLCIDGESDNPSGSVNFSKVSHAKFSFDMTGYSGNTLSADVEFYIDIYGVSYNWLQIRDGRALVSFA
jgi:hypothetical protein